DGHDSIRTDEEVVNVATAWQLDGVEDAPVGTPREPVENTRDPAFAGNALQPGASPAVIPQDPLVGVVHGSRATAQLLPFFVHARPQALAWFSKREVFPGLIDVDRLASASTLKHVRVSCCPGNEFC